jgi:hypothetical protein
LSIQIKLNTTVAVVGTALTIKVLPCETKPALLVVGPGYSRLELGPLGHPAVLKDLVLQSEDILKINAGGPLGTVINLISSCRHLDGHSN